MAAAIGSPILAMGSSTRFAGPATGAVIQLGLMDLTLDRQLTLPDQVTIRGAGRERTRIVSTYQYRADSLGCAFESGNDTVVENLTLECFNPDSKVQMVAIGFGADRPAIRKLTVRRCLVRSPEWGFYSWTKPDGNLAEIEDSMIECGYQCASWCNSGGADSQRIVSRNNVYRAGVIPQPIQGRRHAPGLRAERLPGRAGRIRPKLQRPVRVDRRRHGAARPAASRPGTTRARPIR